MKHQPTIATTNNKEVNAQVETNKKRNENKVSSYACLSQFHELKFDDSIISDYEYILSLNNVDLMRVVKGEFELYISADSKKAISIDELTIRIANFAMIYAARNIAQSKTIQNRIGHCEIAELDAAALINGVWCHINDTFAKRVAEVQSGTKDRSMNNGYIVTAVNTYITNMLDATSKQINMGYRLSSKHRNAIAILQDDVEHGRLTKEEFEKEFNKLTGRKGNRNRHNNSIIDSLYYIMTTKVVFIDKERQNKASGEMYYDSEFRFMPTTGEAEFRKSELDRALENYYQKVSIPENITANKVAFVADCVQVILDDLGVEDFARHYKMDVITADAIIGNVKEQLASDNSLYVMLKNAA